MPLSIGTSPTNLAPLSELVVMPTPFAQYPSLELGFGTLPPVLHLLPPWAQAEIQVPMVVPMYLLPAWMLLVGQPWLAFGRFVPLLVSKRSGTRFPWYPWKCWELVPVELLARAWF